jgi:hypothetical protein
MRQMWTLGRSPSPKTEANGTAAKRIHYGKHYGATYVGYRRAVRLAHVRFRV